MLSTVILWIACRCLFDCCAIVFLLLDKRKIDGQARAFQEHLEEIDYHLNGSNGEWQAIDMPI
jgi:hypothetical protein